MPSEASKPADMPIRIGACRFGSMHATHQRASPSVAQGPCSSNKKTRPMKVRHHRPCQPGQTAAQPGRHDDFQARPAFVSRTV